MTPPATTQEQLISVEAAAGRLDVSLRSLYRLIAQKQLPPPLKVGRSSKLCENEINAYIEKLKARRS